MDDREIARNVALFWIGSNQERVKVRTAIVLAESGGDPKARNYCCTGLAQIHKQHAGGPPGSPSSEEAFRTWLEVPQNNMVAAKWVEQRQGLGAWSAYTNGSYREYLDRAEAVKDVTGQAGPGGDLSPGDIAGDLATGVVENLNPATAIQNLFDVASGFVTFVTDPKTWARMALVVGGVIVAVVGVAVVVRPIVEPTATKAAKAVTTKGMVK